MKKTISTKMLSYNIYANKKTDVTATKMQVTYLCILFYILIFRSTEYFLVNIHTVSTLVTHFTYD